MRRSLPWLLGLPVMAAGSLAAHSVSYLFATAHAGEASGEASERANTGSASYVVLFLAVAAATAFVAAGARLVLGRRKHRSGEISPSLFLVLPPLAG